MKRTTNKIQEQYMIAKAHLEALEAGENELEQQYIIGNGITNADGSTPDHIYCIDDEEAFNRANEEMAATLEASGLWNEILAAKTVLSAAEVKLIEYGLSTVPTKERETLEKAAKENYITRLKIIDLVLRLDASTIK